MSDLGYLTYTTLQGDTFDMLALDFYNSSSKTSLIIDANPDHVGTIVFAAGVELKIPIILNTDTKSAALPPWRE